MTNAAVDLDATTPEQVRTAIIAKSIERLWKARGIFLSFKEYDALAHGIRSGLYTQVATDRLGQPVYALTLRGETIYAVWSPMHDCVRTFLARNIVRKQATADGEAYDGQRDLAGSIADGLATIRKRKSAGGPGWEPSRG